MDSSVTPSGSGPDPVLRRSPGVLPTRFPDRLHRSGSLSGHPALSPSLPVVHVPAPRLYVRTHLFRWSSETDPGLRVGGLSVSSDGLRPRVLKWSVTWSHGSGSTDRGGLTREGTLVRLVFPVCPSSGFPISLRTCPQVLPSVVGPQKPVPSRFEEGVTTP